MDEHFTNEMQEEILSFQVKSSAPWKSDFDSALVKVGKQLTDISDSIMGIKTGLLSSMVDLPSKRRDRCAEKERNRAALEICQAVAVVEKSASTGEKTDTEENEAKLQKMMSGFRICKPQSTFIWPNMGASNGSSLVVVQFEDLFVVNTPPSVSSSTASAPPQLPYHHQHPPTSPIRPVPERRAATVTLKIAQSNDNHDYSSTPVIAFPRGKSNTSISNLNDILDSDGAFITTAAERHESSLRSQARRSCGGSPKRKRKQDNETPAKRKKRKWCVKDLSVPIEGVIEIEIDILEKYKQFNAPVADQKELEICGPLSICENIGMMFAIQTGLYRVLASQEMITWMAHFEPYYLHNKNKPEIVSTMDGKSSQSISSVDGFGYVMESGIHENDNYPFVGGCDIKFPVDVEMYEKMRSTFKDGQRHERYSIEGYKHLVVEENVVEDDKIINEVIGVLNQGVLVNGMIWASTAFTELPRNVIFDQELDPIFDKDSGFKQDHIILIHGHGKYKGRRIFLIKNTYGLFWGNGGYAYVFACQIREYTFIIGKVFSTGATPPKRIVVFYTSKDSGDRAEEFAKNSNKRYATVWEDNVRHANVTFIPWDLDDYATNDDEFRAKLRNESVALFLMDYQPDEEEPDHLVPFYEFLGKRKSAKSLRHLQHAVFALNEIAAGKRAAKKTDSGLCRLGARRLIKMPAVGVKFPEWQEMVWMELDKVHGVKKGDARRAQEDCYPSSSS